MSATSQAIVKGLYVLLLKCLELAHYIIELPSIIAVNEIKWLRKEKERNGRKKKEMEGKRKKKWE